MYIVNIYSGGSKTAGIFFLWGEILLQLSESLFLAALLDTFWKVRSLVLLEKSTDVAL